MKAKWVLFFFALAIVLTASAFTADSAEAAAGDCGMPVPYIDPTTWGNIPSGQVNYIVTSAGFCNGKLVAEVFSKWAGRSPTSTWLDHQTITGWWKVRDEAGRQITGGNINVSNNPQVDGVLVFDEEWSVPQDGRTYRIEIYAELHQNTCGNFGGNGSSSAEGTVPPPHEWQWSPHFGCDVLKVSVLIDQGDNIRADGWIWDSDGNELLHHWEIVTPGLEAWFNAMMDTPLNYVGHVTARIVLSGPVTGDEIASKDFATEAPLNCEPVCVDDGLFGSLDYGGNHLSGLPVSGEVWNPSERSCDDVAYLHVFGSMHLEPEGPKWLEEQDYVTTFTIPVPEGNEHVAISESFDNSQYCWYQVDLVPVAEVRNPPYYSGEDMLDYVFVKGTNPACQPPTGSVTVDKIDEAGQPWPGVTIDLLQDGNVVTTGQTPVTFDGLALGNYTVREVVPEGSEPMGPMSYDFTVDSENLSFSSTFQNRRIPTGNPVGGGDAVCKKWSGYVQADENHPASYTFEVNLNEKLVFSESGTLEIGQRREFGDEWSVKTNNNLVAIRFRVESDDGVVTEDEVIVEDLDCKHGRWYPPKKTCPFCGPHRDEFRWGKVTIFITSCTKCEVVWDEETQDWDLGLTPYSGVYSGGFPISVVDLKTLKSTPLKEYEDPEGRKHYLLEGDAIADPTWRTLKLIDGLHEGQLTWWDLDPANPDRILSTWEVVGINNVTMEFLCGRTPGWWDVEEGMFHWKVGHNKSEVALWAKAEFGLSYAEAYDWARQLSEAGVGSSLPLPQAQDQEPAQEAQEEGSQQPVVGLVDYLKGAGMSSSFPARAQLALERGVVESLDEYTGSAAQNIALLNLLTGGG